MPPPQRAFQLITCGQIRACQRAAANNAGGDPRAGQATVRRGVTALWYDARRCAASPATCSRSARRCRCCCACWCAWCGLAAMRITASRPRTGGCDVVVRGRRRTTCRRPRWRPTRYRWRQQAVESHDVLGFEWHRGTRPHLFRRRLLVFLRFAGGACWAPASLLLISPGRGCGGRRGVAGGNEPGSASMRLRPPRQPGAVPGVRDAHREGEPVKRVAPHIFTVCSAASLHFCVATVHPLGTSVRRIMR